MSFYPREILFSPVTFCNLNCAHCITFRSKKVLSIAAAIKFLKECKKKGINKVGFSGGEPFLAIEFLYKLVKETVNQDLFFGKITTNAAWFRNKRQLKEVLADLKKIGYDGSFCVSVDAFHNQNLDKAAAFIKTALSIWERKDLISIVSVYGAKDKETESMLQKLSKTLKTRLFKFSGENRVIKNDSTFIKLNKIELSPIAEAGKLKNPWSDTKWFKEDYCKGPGNIFFVDPEGNVKPCCGYACDLDELTIGNIKKDCPDKIIKLARGNRYVRSIFGIGLSRIRKNLQKLAVKFPGKTSNHCFFCHYIFSELPRNLLNQAI